MLNFWPFTDGEDHKTAIIVIGAMAALYYFAKK